MKTMNAAERIRESLGCYNIMLHLEKPSGEKLKKKKVRYGDMLKAHFDNNRHKAKPKAKPRTPVQAAMLLAA